uniref:Uncharacterized protein n=1 Tax=Malurus cyaneus samueli TaxID=2593467 RepID=A0A8C5X351_9PASS
KPRRDALLDLVDRELPWGHIEPSTSPWNTPVFVIPKQNGENFEIKLAKTVRKKLMKTVSFCLQDYIIGHPRNPYTPVPKEDDKLANTQCFHDVSYYICPSSNPGRPYCNSPGHYYCAYRGCETIASDWEAGPDRYLKVGWGPYGFINPPKDPLRPGFAATHGTIKNWCLYLTLNVTNENDSGWIIGKTWGLRFWESGRDSGRTFAIKKREIKNSTAIGPNAVVKSNGRQGKNSLPIPTPIQVSSPPTRQVLPSIGPNAELHQLPDRPFFDVLDATFRSLNQSNPGFTNSCWLCYDVYPPFYEGIALIASFDYSSEATQAVRWDTPRKGITLVTVRQSTCFGKPSNKWTCCSATPSQSQPIGPQHPPENEGHAIIGVTPPYVPMET